MEGQGRVHVGESVSVGQDLSVRGIESHRDPGLVFQQRSGRRLRGHVTRTGRGLFYKAVSEYSVDCGDEKDVGR